jgi:type II secretory pathway pseudopilin PulG
VVNLTRNAKERIAAGQAGFSLVEMLAALLGVVVVFGAATGFMLTAFLRQRAVLQATHLEALHSNFALTIAQAVKVADRFRIYADRATYLSSPESLGAARGNLLVCWARAESGSTVEADFEFTGGELIGRRTAPNGNISINTCPQARLAAGSGQVFDLSLGLVEGQWELTTSQDWVPFRVCAMPLLMR